MTEKQNLERRALHERHLHAVIKAMASGELADQLAVCDAFDALLDWHRAQVA